MSTTPRPEAPRPLGVFSSRDLRLRSGELFAEAEENRLAVITKHGRPTLLGVPFNERLLELGIHRALALQLFEGRSVSLAQAARLAGLSQAAFLTLLAQTGIPAVDYPPEDLEAELAGEA